MGTNKATVSGVVDFQGFSTWYEIHLPAHQTQGKLPLLVAHGGPGVPHNYLLSISDITDFGRPVVFYDQLGCGDSTHLPNKDSSFWTPALFAAELDNLVKKVGLLSNGYHLLGQSWGGMLAQEFAVQKPRELRALVLSNTTASFPAFQEAAQRWISELPKDVQEALTKHEKAKTYSDPEYLAACDVFYRRHVCRLDAYPPEVQRSFDLLDEDPTVYHTMNGPSEFHVIGTAKDWSSIDRLHLIENPTLLICGRYDEAAPEIQTPLLRGITNSTLHIFENSSHMPFWEERDLYMEVVESFISEHD